MSDLMTFTAARLAEAWATARDAELTRNLDESPQTRTADALREILALHGGRHECPGNDGYAWYGDGEAPWCPTSRAVAAIWEGHADYDGSDPRWKP